MKSKTYQDLEREAAEEKQFDDALEKWFMDPTIVSKVKKIDVLSQKSDILLNICKSIEKIPVYTGQAHRRQLESCTEIATRLCKSMLRDLESE